jgi:hypothetical protein
VRGRPIQKGQVLNPKGRPVGSRQKISERFIDLLAKDFEAHGETAIVNLREQKPDAYIRVVADLVPKDVTLTVDPSHAFLEMLKMVSGGKS